MGNCGKNEYASQIVKSEFGGRYTAFNVEQTGTETKNHSFIISEQETPKYFLKIHRKKKPLKEKLAADFYRSQGIVETPKIWSIGEDYTITSYEESLERLNFFEHVESLANFHYRLMEPSHETIDKNLFSHFSKQEFENLLDSNKEVIENIINFKDFYSLYSDLSSSVDDEFLSPILIHGDPHRGNLLKNEGEYFFLDLEHTKYARQTVDLARLCYNYPVPELKNVFAIYRDCFGCSNSDLEKIVSGTLSDILFEGALTVIACHKNGFGKNFTQTWEKKLEEYFGFLKSKMA